MQDRAIGMALLSLLFLGCNDWSGPNWFEHPGHLESVVIPDIFTVGTPARVLLTTIGDGCTRKGPTRVSVRGSTVEIAPFDTSYTGICIDIGIILDHSFDLTFTN